MIYNIDIVERKEGESVLINDSVEFTFLRDFKPGTPNVVARYDEKVLTAIEVEELCQELTNLMAREIAKLQKQ